MSPNLWDDKEFWCVLLKIENDLAETRQEKGCECGGALHRAGYRRKPRGGPRWLGEDYEWRQSFCCAREGCRRRATPPSVLFLGRRVYFGLVMSLVSALRQGPTARSREALRSWIGMDVRTLRRWQRWWREVFPGLPFWHGVRGSWGARLRGEAMPRALWESFVGKDALTQTVQFLRFLAPLGVRGN